MYRTKKCDLKELIMLRINFLTEERNSHMLAYLPLPLGKLEELLSPTQAAIKLGLS